MQNLSNLSQIESKKNILDDRLNDNLNKSTDLSTKQELTKNNNFLNSEISSLSDLQEDKKEEELKSAKENKEYESLLQNLQEQKLIENNNNSFESDVNEENINDVDYLPINIDNVDKNKNIEIENINEDFALEDPKYRYIFLAGIALAAIVGLALGLTVGVGAAVGTSLAIFFTGLITSSTSFYMARITSVDDIKQKIEQKGKNNEKENEIDFNIPNYQKAKENSMKSENENINEIKSMNDEKYLRSLENPSHQYQNL